MKAATVSVELTERELSYLRELTGYPNGRFPQLQVKLGDAFKDMREAKRVRNRALKAERNEKRLLAVQVAQQ